MIVFGSMEEKRSRVRNMFNAIAPGYDAANRLMSLGRDGRWRAIVAERCELGEGGRALDLCCGTGELGRAILKSSRASRVVGLDFSREMLDIAKKKATDEGMVAALDFVEADATRLPFPDASFDAAAVGWGLRNVPDLLATIAELVRVVRPGGKIVSIDMGHPPLLLIASIYWAFSSFFVPAVGRAVSGDRAAYRYLHESAKDFLDQGELGKRFEDAGMVEVRVKNFMAGAVALVEGRRP